MADDPLTDELVGLVPPDLRDVSGHLLYTGRDAWTGPSPLYLMGVNPGGDPDVIRETVTSSTERILRHEAANWSAYRDDRWTYPSGGTRPPGTAPMQQNVLHMLSTLGLDPGTVPASNLVFVRSRAEGDIPRQQMRALAEACWPFHRGVIDRLGIRVVVCFGGTAGDFVRANIGARHEVDRFVEANGRGWTSRTYRGRSGVKVVQVTHPSRAMWLNPAADVSPPIGRALGDAVG